MSEKLLTIREVAALLGLTEKEVIDLAESEVIPAYKVGGVYLRFRRDQVEEYKRAHRPAHKKHPVAIAERLSDFWYFNDFYIFALIIIIVLVYCVIML